ncbi:hypothetical protein BU25DRAFT_335593 [Macroventuria anomochaeta]|uniref:Uncharacterized protein n=1 Tax=Macroventuria anomochaeta TaxID=301207 RepID=A0ACB6S914_9PLEO|nr:uncharacterized protein BU25DRAFT_335593 [Macroventuria anomochaeta]KAF2630544.1 hypothetical protein BU25DRAFT_335593 [Macroventuria anomochaeta]
MSSSDDRDSHVHVQSKRRRVRKGTHSCWECKRRKVKCLLDPIDHSICNGCRRRGTKCISQEYPDDATERASILREGSLHTTPSENGPESEYLPTPPESVQLAAPSRSLTFQQSRLPVGISSTAQDKHARLSQFLYQSLPLSQDMEIICNSHTHPFVPVLAHEMLTVPYTTLQKDGLQTPQSLLKRPGPTSHPVLIARHMLHVAIFLQHVFPSRGEPKGLSETPRAIRDRLSDLAISLVTSNDELLGSIEGLECVMLESMYQANVGNLRRSWVSGRRAIGVAQLMALDQTEHRKQYKVLDPQTEHHPQLMWFRIIFLSRHLSLMLGLPQGVPDSGTFSGATFVNDTPTGRLEQIHCILASRILDRNAAKSSDYALTRSLDSELQKAARNLPSRWWLAPNLESITATNSEALFWDTRRLFAQVLHYNLLNQLHLPYMLRSSMATENQYRYSMFTCVNASRELLSRFITLRGFNQIAYSWSCRIVDFLALMAAMSLLLAHLDSHGSEDTQSLLAHQYITDRAMIEQAQEHMEEMNRLNSDALSAESADLLRRLLAVQAESLDEGGGFARRVSVHDTAAEAGLPDTLLDDSVVSVHVPYFGVIKIAREGVSKQAPVDVSTITTRSQVTSDNTNLSESSFYEVLPTNPMQYEQTPELAAGGADWPFQGVDMAFFDSLMSTVGSQGNDAFSNL